MPLIFDYQCNLCRNIATNQSMESFFCPCGGLYKLYDRTMMNTPIFDSYYDPSVETYLTSYREQEKVGKHFRSPQHQQGFTIRQDTKFHKETEYIKKHKHEYLEMQAKQAGKKYDPKLGKLIATLLLLFLTSTSYALEGSGNVELTIQGKTYVAPQANPEHTQELYYLKKAINGDKEAREIIMGNQWHGMVFIGDTKPLWVKVTKDSITVIGDKNGT